MSDVIEGVHLSTLWDIPWLRVCLPVGFTNITFADLYHFLTFQTTHSTFLEGLSSHRTWLSIRLVTGKSGNDSGADLTILPLFPRIPPGEAGV